MSAIQIVKSERGRDHVFLNGFTFRRAYYHSTVGGWKWRCTNKKCSANMYLDNELSILPGSLYEHNHSPLSRKRQHLKELALMEPFLTTAASPPSDTATGEEPQSATNCKKSNSELPKNGEAVNEIVLKPKRVRGNGSGVRRKRQKKLPSLENAPEGTHHLAEDHVFSLDQCDSNTVFVNIFENQPQNTEHVNRSSVANPTTVEVQPENFDPLSETFKTTAFPAICNLSPKDETRNEIINVGNEEDGAAEINTVVDDSDDDCLLYEDIDRHKNVRGYPSQNAETFKNTASRPLCGQNSRARSMQGSIDLSHPIDTFFYAMAQSVKHLSTVNQIKAKQMITKLITKFEMDEAV